MRRHHKDRPFGPDVTYTALQESCPDCGRLLPVYQNDKRVVQGLQHQFWLHRRDKRCRRSCTGDRTLYRAVRDPRVVLPGRMYGLDVFLHIGERHLADGVALAQISRDLKRDHGLPVDQSHTCQMFRDFVALTSLVGGDDLELCERLRAQGGIVLMCDGVQFEDRSPVLYLVWDALSGQPLFGERKLYRGEQDLIPLLEGVRDMNVPIIGVVTDKEKGLVPAIKHVFPDAPYQYCHTHYLKNCARPLQLDTSALGASVRRRADAVRKIGKELAHNTADAAVDSATPQGATTSDACDAPSPAEMSEAELVAEVCELVRVNSRVSGKAPLAPPELKRHQRLEEIRTFVDDARKKTPCPGRPQGT